MKNALFILTLSWLISCQSEPVQHPPTEPAMHMEDDGMPQVALFGTFHFEGSYDLVSMNVPDLETDKRQKEIVDVVNALSEFNPTKILVEFPASRQATYDSLYAAYLAGNHALSINEIQQVGFRLAKKLGLPGVIGIDYNMDLPFEDWFLAAQAHDSTLFETVLTDFRAMGDRKEAFIAEHTLKAFFAQLNTTAADNENKQFYFEIAPSVVPDTSATAMAMAAAWWERNLFWMQQIDRHIGAEDRVLVICGSGHRSVLKDFYLSRSDVQYVEIGDFIKD